MESLVTQRLIIRHPRKDDLADFLAYQTHPESLKYQPVAPLTEGAAERFLSRMAATEIGEDGGYVMFAVELRGEGRMIGEVGINRLPEPQSKGEVGWSLHPAYWGHGYATEAAQALLEFGFAQWNLHRVTSACDTRNAASFRLLERLGMRREGHLRQSQLTHGVWRDEYLYALLRDEWLSRQRAA